MDDLGVPPVSGNLHIPVVQLCEDVHGARHVEVCAAWKLDLWHQFAQAKLTQNGWRLSKWGIWRPRHPNPKNMEKEKKKHVIFWISTHCHSWNHHLRLQKLSVESCPSAPAPCAVPSTKAVIKGCELLTSTLSSLDWLMGKFTGKAPYFMGSSMVSCRFSQKPIHWYQLVTDHPSKAAANLLWKNIFHTYR